MCEKSLTFCMLLLIVSSLAFQPNSTHDDNKDNNLIVCEFGEDTKRNYDEKAELRKNYTNDNKDNYMKVIKIEIRKSQSLKHIVSHGMCDNITYIHILCCPLSNCLVHKNCIAEENEYVFSNEYNYLNDLMQNENKKIDKIKSFPLIVQNVNQIYHYFDMKFKPGSHPFFEFVESTTYCLGNEGDDQFNRSICSQAVIETINKEIEKITRDVINKIMSTQLTILFYNYVVSMLCLLLTFLVYYILPELRNNNSFMLRRSISLEFIAYTIMCIDYLFITEDLEYSICVTSALIRYFCMLTSDFWLSLMSFDMWWTFRNLWLQGNVSTQRQKRKQQERKKFIYSTIAWGGPLILTIIYIIMEFVPSVPKMFRPAFGGKYCRFNVYEAVSLYFGLNSICIISSTCLSIYTALKILRYEKNTTCDLSHLERQSFNDQKQWCNLYLKLSIVLSVITVIRWILKILLVYQVSDVYTMWYYIIVIHRITFLMNTMETIGTFIIFVCKKRIMLLLKHFCQNHGCISKSSKQNHCYELQQLRHH